MSVSITTDLFCDGDKCGSQWQAGCTRGRSAAGEVIEAARKAGWTIGKKHLCPECNGRDPAYWHRRGKTELAGN